VVVVVVRGGVRRKEAFYVRGAASCQWGRGVGWVRMMCGLLGGLSVQGPTDVLIPILTLTLTLIRDPRLAVQ